MGSILSGLLVHIDPARQVTFLPQYTDHAVAVRGANDLEACAKQEDLEGVDSRDCEYVVEGHVVTGVRQVVQAELLEKHAFQHSWSKHCVGLHVPKTEEGPKIVKAKGLEFVAIIDQAASFLCIVLY
jgi:hypothetical protein